MGKVSFTSDLWSDSVLTSYMGLTAHYMVENGPAKDLELKSVLIAFHPLEGKHNAKNLAQIVVNLTDRAEVTDKVRPNHVPGAS